MKIKIGDKVETIDDAITGIVVSIKLPLITVETEDGFSFDFNENELIVLNSTDSIELENISRKSIAENIKSKEESKSKRSLKVSSKKRHQATFVIDLHIHQLTDSTKGMSNYDMLNLQLDTARRQLEFAIKKRIPKLVFIHGIGEGVLKQELYTVLRRYNNVTFYDADYKDYGLGATEVKIFQNVDP
ncbi:MAG: DNA mismatch repair protein MutS [Winogradskyella sp.]|uniref:Smr/MutS family protein n=1 Tax=Winogradskyella sp. TaxID=1883156 RepID=UPI000F3AC89E|nr:Smr/MutS family protein [Winogradskyella sp.]RNC87123.1 MAG: DNA mismatch repair protein MutS [Winogradskyella sp.]